MNSPGVAWCHLKRIIPMIDEEDWSAMDVDVKGAAFEGLLEKAASEGRKGAGQYFTPRPLIQAIVQVMRPDPRGKPSFRICDPACGTGGFLVCSYEWLICAKSSRCWKRRKAWRNEFGG
ncbi:MAG: HsdM family class I SAM-dependent methyltransferase [Limisphaerales bacterium]